MNLSPLPIQKFFDNNGRPLVGGLLFTYEAGTSTKIATYIDSSGATPNTNPVVLNFRGECRLWIDPTLAYKFVLSPADDTDPPTDPIWSVDDITAGPAQQDNAADDTGSVNNVQLSIPQISSPIAFTRIVFKAANTNTGPMTVSVNGGTAKALTWQNIGAFSGGEVQAGGIYEAIYDGAQWQLQGPTLQPPQQLAPAEVAAGLDVTDIVDWSYQCGFVDRYGKNSVPGTTNMTAAVQLAVNVCKTDRIPVRFLASTYLITDTILLYRGSVLQGKTANQLFASFGVQPKGTDIEFAPTSLKSLFAFQSGSAFVLHVSISGMYLHGSGGTNCLYGIDLDWVIYGNFHDLSIDGFRHGLRVYHSIQNLFTNIFTTGTVSALLYAGGSSTTDSWYSCTFFGSPIGVRLDDSNINIRFVTCNFEQLDNYGIDISRECQSIGAVACYSEDVPFTANANGAMFRVGYTGSSTLVENALIIEGGVFQGRNAGTIGNMIDTDNCNGIIAGGFNVSRYTRVVRATTNTRARSLFFTGCKGISYTGFSADATTDGKFTGIYPNATLDTSGADMSARFGSIDARSTITSENGDVISRFVLGVFDGISTPATVANRAQIYVDSADGSLKVKFGNGNVHLIATNP